MSDKKKSGWPELGMITKNVKQKQDDNGNWVDDLDANGQKQYVLKFKLADDITILRDGQAVALNNSRTGIMKTPQQEVAGLIRAGQIPEGQQEDRKQKAEAAHSWCRYKVQLPPPRD